MRLSDSSLFVHDDEVMASGEAIKLENLNSDRLGKPEKAEVNPNPYSEREPDPELEGELEPKTLVAELEAD